MQLAAAIAKLSDAIVRVNAAINAEAVKAARKELTDAKKKALEVIER